MGSVKKRILSIAFFLAVTANLGYHCFLFHSFSITDMLIFLLALLIIIDTEKRQKKLEDKSTELEMVSENLAGGILVTAMEKDFPIIRCNMGYYRLLGLSEQETLVGKTALEHVIKEDRSMVERQIKEQMNDSNHFLYCEHRLRQKNGGILWVTLRGKKMTMGSRQVGIWLMTDITNVKVAEQELKMNEERYRIAFQNTDDIIIDYEVKSKSMYHSSKATERYRVPELMNRIPESILELGVVAGKSEEELRGLFQQIHEGVPKVSAELLVRATDGSFIWNELSFTTIFDEEGRPVRAIGMIQDISRAKDAERMYENEVKYKNLTMNDAALYYEANLTQSCFTAGYEKLVESYLPEMSNDFDTLEKLLVNHMVYGPDRKLVDSYIDRAALLREYVQGKRKIVFQYRHQNNVGGPGWVECTLYLTKEEESGDIFCVAYVRDINEAKQREDFYRKKSEHDLLSGLYNKITTENLIKEFLRRAQKKSDGGLKGAFVLIDLDNFKNINDTYGHAFGDSVLTSVGHKLSEMFSERDILGRIGGDEFCVFICNPNERSEITDRVKTLGNMFYETYAGKKLQRKMSVSIGISLCPDNGTTFRELYENADRALYDAKKKGKDTYSYFHNGL